MRTLITGGAGFIGSNLAAYHLKNGDEVFVVDDLSTGSINNVQNMLGNPRFHFYKHNLLTWERLAEVLQQVDRVYHFAAVVGMFHVLAHPIETLQVNIDGTIKIFQSILDLRVRPLVIVASSSEVYGNQHHRLSEHNPLTLEGSSTNHAAYTISKLGQESVAQSFWHQEHIPSIVLRIFNTIGRNQSSRYGMVVPRFVQQALLNKDMTVFGNGSQKRSFCNVDDTVNLITLLAENKKSVGEIVNVGDDNEVTINHLASLTKKLCGSKSMITHVPLVQVYHNQAMHITERQPELTKLKELTHYKYKWSLEKTILDIAKYQRNYVMTRIRNPKHKKLILQSES